MWIGFLVASQFGTLAFAHDRQGTFVSTRSARNDSEVSRVSSILTNDSMSSRDYKQMSPQFLRKLSVLDFVASDQEWVESEEEVVRCELHLIADFRMSLIAEAGILLGQSVWTVLRIREASVVQLGMESSSSVDEGLPNPAELDLQTFKFGFAVLPPQGGSQDISFMLRKASESAILVKFKELVLSSQAMQEA